jgi:hypothetical protein
MARILDRAGRIVSAAREATGRGVGAFSRGYDAVAALTDQPGDPIEYKPFDPGTVTAGAVAAKALTALLSASRARANRRRELERQDRADQHLAVQDEYLRARSAAIGQPPPESAYQREQIRVADERNRLTGERNKKIGANTRERSHASDIARAQAGLAAESQDATAIENADLTNRANRYAEHVRRGTALATSPTLDPIRRAYWDRRRREAATALGVNLDEYTKAGDTADRDQYGRPTSLTKEDVLGRAYGTWLERNKVRRGAQRVSRFAPQRRALTSAAAGAAGVSFGDTGAPAEEDRYAAEDEVDYAGAR